MGAYEDTTNGILDLLKSWAGLATKALIKAGYFEASPEIRAGFDLDKIDWDKLARASQRKNARAWSSFWKGWGNKVFERGGERVISGAGVSMKHKDKRQLADEYFKERGLQHVKQLSDTDIKSLRAAIRQNIYLNEKQFAKKYADAYPCSKARLRRIKRTEAHNALEYGGYNYARNTGAGWKQSVNVGDRRVRESHISASAEGWIPIDQPFASTGRLVADEVNCRCHLIYRYTTPKGVKAGQRVKIGGTGPTTPPYEISAEGITNKENLKRITDRHDKLAKEFQISGKFGGFRSYDNVHTPASVKHFGDDCFVTGWGAEYGKDGAILRDKDGNMINKVFVYMPPGAVNSGKFSQMFAEMGIVYAGDLEATVTHEFAHVIQKTAVNKFGNSAERVLLDASERAIKEAGITPEMINKNVSMYANGFMVDSSMAREERYAEFFTASQIPSPKMSKAFKKRLAKYQKLANGYFEEWGGVGRIV